jgi:hypothetical protein
MNTANQQKKYRQTLSACQEADCNTFVGREMKADGGIYTTRGNNVRTYRKTLKNRVDPFRTKGSEC